MINIITKKHFYSIVKYGSEFVQYEAHKEDVFVTSYEEAVGIGVYFMFNKKTPFIYLREICRILVPKEYDSPGLGDRIRQYSVDPGNWSIKRCPEDKHYTNNELSRGVSHYIYEDVEESEPIPIEDGTYILDDSFESLEFSIVTDEVYRGSSVQKIVSPEVMSLPISWEEVDYKLVLIRSIIIWITQAKK